MRLWRQKGTQQRESRGRTEYIRKKRKDNEGESNFWSFLAYCAGTGGSILIIGSAAGVAAMGIEKISFIWYAKKVTLIAFVGYLAGAIVFYLQSMIF